MTSPEKKPRRPRQNLAGERFGKLVVVEFSYYKREGNDARPYWLCRCDCGEFTCVRGTNLRSGAVTSCGCSRRSS